MLYIQALSAQMFIVVEMYNFELCYNIQPEVYKRFGTLKVVYLIDNYALNI